MSRFAPLILALAFVTPSTAHSQQLLSLGLRGGISQATMTLSGDASPSGRTGFLVGPTGTIWLSDGLGIQFDALYVTKGFRPDAATGVTTTLDLSYLDVPVTAVLNLPRVSAGMFQARLQGGAALGFRVQCAVTDGGAAVGIQDCNPDNVATFDLGLVGGGGRQDRPGAWWVHPRCDLHVRPAGRQHLREQYAEREQPRAHDQRGLPVPHHLKSLPMGPGGRTA